MVLFNRNLTGKRWRYQAWAVCCAGMTKNKIAILAFIALISFPGCTSYKARYVIPAAFPERSKDELYALLEKGRILYNGNCADCHNTVFAGKNRIPGFTSLQIDNYATAVAGRNAKNHAVIKQMSPEQLNQVITFLTYVKRRSTDSLVLREKKA